MLPNGFEILSCRFSAYGLLATLGAFLAWLLLVRLNDREVQPLSDGSVFALCLVFYAAFYLGAVIMGLVTACISAPTRISDFSGSLTEFIRHISAAKSLYGGLILSICLSPIFARLTGRSRGDILRLIMPLVPLLLFFGRLGCFMSGCCYGVEASWGQCFPAGGIAPANTPLVPTQLISATAQLLLFVLLIVLRQRMSGEELTLLYLGLYAPFRFLLEFWRGDAVPIGFLSLNQWISLAVLLFILPAWLILRRKNRPC